MNFKRIISGGLEVMIVWVILKGMFKIFRNNLIFEGGVGVMFSLVAIDILAVTKQLWSH